MIPLRQLEEMFANMRAQTKWDIDGELLWGYFFTDHDVSKLEKVSHHLSQAGYEVVRIFLAGDNRTHVLHVERVEKHTPQTLDARNAELADVAVQFALQSYDGMDVGPVSRK
jgi:Regulator of ribonuclease activity B